MRSKHNAKTSISDLAVSERNVVVDCDGGISICIVANHSVDQNLVWVFSLIVLDLEGIEVQAMVVMHVADLMSHFDTV